MPKNKTRNTILKQKLFIYRGPYHDLMPSRLPQFTERDPIDINEHFQLGDKLFDHKNEYKITYASDPNNIPEEFADLEVDIDEDISVPLAQ